MSQTETNPLMNPTIKVSLPTQEMEVKPPSIMDSVDLIPFTRNVSNFSIEQLDFTKLSQKNKILNTFDWTISAGESEIYSYQIDIAMLRTLMPITRKFMNFAQTSQLFLSIKPTNNAFFQGYANIFWDPSPSNDYIERIWGQTINSYTSFQFKCYPLTPKTSNEINFMVPINFPFQYIPLNPTDSVSPLDVYYRDYRFGRLRVYGVSPLRTTSPLIKLTQTVSGQLMDLATAGTFFYGVQ
jgi:hypothetical protein